MSHDGPSDLDEVATVIRRVLPGLKEAQESALLSHLYNLGVRVVSDLQYVEQHELSAVLNLVSTRKLLKLWNQSESVAIL